MPNTVVVCWPNWILLTGLASKELLLAALLPTAILAYLWLSARNRAQNLSHR